MRGRCLFASTSKAGIGGWWCPAAVFKADEVRWFSLQFSKSDLPSWLRADSSTGLQAFIASFEALAQLVLLLLRDREACLDHRQPMVVRFKQLCDNQSICSATGKMLTNKAPLCFILQALGYWCSSRAVHLHVSHLAGERNGWADSLSRQSVPDGLLASMRRSLDIRDILCQPWARLQ